MKTLLVLLLVSGLVAESSAWQSFSEFKESVKDKYGNVESFFQGLGKKAKDFVTGKKGEFTKLSNAMKEKLQKLEDCEKCKDGACNDDDNIKCEELYINYVKVRDFMDCTEDPTRNDCALTLGRRAKSPPKRELSKRQNAGIVEKEDADADQQKQERRVAALLTALLKKTQK